MAEALAQGVVVVVGDDVDRGGVSVCVGGIGGVVNGSVGESVDGGAGGGADGDVDDDVGVCGDVSSMCVILLAKASANMLQPLLLRWRPSLQKRLWLRSPEPFVQQPACLI